MEKYQHVLSRNSMGEVKEIVDRSRDMLEATLECNESQVAQLLIFPYFVHVMFNTVRDFIHWAGFRPVI